MYEVCHPSICHPSIGHPSIRSSEHLAIRASDHPGISHPSIGHPVIRASDHEHLARLQVPFFRFDLQGFGT